MPKNKGTGGKGFRRGLKNTGEVSSRDLVIARENEKYAKVVQHLGDSRLKVQFIDGKEVIGIIPGKLKRKVYMKKDDLVLVSIRSYQSDKVDILHKYDNNEIGKLIKIEEIPNNMYAITEDNGEILFVENQDDENEDLGIDDL